LVRSRSVNLSTTLGGEFKSYNNVSGGATASDYRNDTLSIGFSGNSFDGLGGGGYNAFSLVAVSGQLDLSRSPTQAADALTAQTAGSFDKLRYSLTRQQDLGSALAVWAALSGQWTSKNLDSSDKFYLGGSNGVRAYPSSEGGGALGQVVNLELRWSLPQGFGVVGFYDWGSVTANVQNSYTGAAQPNTYALEGAGLALAWRHRSGLSVRATYARRLGNNPNPITTAMNHGYDQDGTLVLDRFWLSATLAF
jgi:hemolysin activation/secretion protein